ncbi:MAG: DUF4339 domain-containing protein [Janthinobacterium lividum]
MTHYQISRNGQMYGPYTLEDLQRYVTSGNVLPTDLAKSEDMSEWVPVSQVLGSQAPGQPFSTGFGNSGFTANSAPASASTGGFSTPGYANPAYTGQSQPAFNASAFPDAPNLYWGIVLLIDIFTCGLFQYVWNIIVAAWLKKVQPNTISLFLYIGVVVLGLVSILVSLPSQMAAFHAAMGHTGASPRTNFLGSGIGLLVWIFRVVTRYIHRASLEEHFNTVENVGLKLNPVMTFFFGGLYFQYHLNKINAYKQAMRMSQPATY